ncbi:MAG: sugar phosphate isomerase/epimerase [Planctomycetes bacterium]|nr:sugar phosphate isomerase/epimerase [Planctomycetota bacterium]
MPIYYNSNGFAHHRLEDVVRVLAGLGYDGIALTPDVAHLDPFRAAPAEVAGFRRMLEETRLGVTIESGARYVLDPRQKHWPALLSSRGFERRQEFYLWLIDLAVEVESPLVSIWSGASEADAPQGDAALDLLAERLKPVLEHAAEQGVLLCFEPEPDMRVETLADYERLRARLSGFDLWLTIDIGHLAAREAPPFDAHLEQHRAVLKNLHLDDATVGQHEHRFFGEGAIDLPAIARRIDAIQYSGVLSVELPAHAREAPKTAERALRALREAGFSLGKLGFPPGSR